VKGHLFGAGDSGAAQLRTQRRQDARRRNEDQAERDDNDAAGTGQIQRRTPE